MHVSVIIPCHNYSRFLSDAIESVLAQKVPTELLVVDDSSTDSPEAVAEAFSVPILRVEHGNSFDTRRSGFHATSAQLACFLDADDRLGDGYLQHAIEALKPDDVGIAFTDLREFGARSRHWRFRGGNIEAANYIHAGAVCKRSALEQCGVMDHPLDDAGNRLEDWWMWRHVLRGPYRAVWTPATYWYRRHTDNQSLRHRKLPSRHLYCRDLKPIWERT